MKQVEIDGRKYNIEFLNLSECFIWDDGYALFIINYEPYCDEVLEFRKYKFKLPKRRFYECNMIWGGIAPKLLVVNIDNRDFRIENIPIKNDIYDIATLLSNLNIKAFIHNAYSWKLFKEDPWKYGQAGYLSIEKHGVVFSELEFDEEGYTCRLRAIQNNDKEILPGVLIEQIVYSVRDTSDEKDELFFYEFIQNGIELYELNEYMKKIQTNEYFRGLRIVTNELIIDIVPHSKELFLMKRNAEGWTTFHYGLLSNAISLVDDALQAQSGNKIDEFITLLKRGENNGK